MKFRLPALAVATATVFVTFGLSSCETVDKIFDPQPPGMAADPMAVVPQDFLYTRYAPLNHWLDEAVRVQILDVRLMSVFDHPTLRGLHYHFVTRPSQNPLLNIDKLAMTRRQLLWSIGHDHQLHMTPVFGSRGEVTHIDIRSRSDDFQETGISSGVVTSISDK